MSQLGFSVLTRKREFRNKNPKLSLPRQKWLREKTWNNKNYFSAVRFSASTLINFISDKDFVRIPELIVGNRDTWNIFEHRIENQNLNSKIRKILNFVFWSLS